MILNDWSFDNRLKYYKNTSEFFTFLAIVLICHFIHKYLLSRSYLFSYVPHVLITKNFIYVPSGSLNRSSLYLCHSSFRSASLSRGQFRLRISARTTTWANRWIWHIVPTDRLNDLINILLHTTFTLRVLFVLSRRMASRTVFISIH